MLTMVEVEIECEPEDVWTFIGYNCVLSSLSELIPVSDEDRVPMPHPMLLRQSNYATPQSFTNCPSPPEQRCDHDRDWLSVSSLSRNGNGLRTGADVQV